MVLRVLFACAALALAVAAPRAALSQQAINLTIASSHPTTFLPVGLMATHFRAEVDRLLAAGGNKFRINWKESYGGALFKLQDTMEAVRDGITDIGFVGTLWEGDTMPLSNITFFTPFSTPNPALQSRVMDHLIRTQPAMRKEWEANNLQYLGPIIVESYDLWTTRPVTSLADLKGRRINAPGVAGLWLQGTGAVAVDGGLPTYYTNIQTGVTEGAVSFYTGILSVRVHEVAPLITTVDLGSMFIGAVAMSLDRFRKLPREVQQALVEAGRSYGERLVAETIANTGKARQIMESQGSKVSVLPAAERAKWISALPNLAGDWVKANEARKLPAREILSAYMAALRKAGEKPARDWDK